MLHVLFSDSDQNDDDPDDHEQFDKGMASTQTNAVRTHCIAFSYKCSTTAFETMPESVAIEPQTGMAPTMVPRASVSTPELRRQSVMMLLNSWDCCFRRRLGNRR